MKLAQVQTKPTYPFIENNEYSFVNNPKYKEKSSVGWGLNPHLLQSRQAP